MNKELKILLLEIRINLLSNRSPYNNSIVRKMQRKLRQLNNGD